MVNAANDTSASSDSAKDLNALNDGEVLNENYSIVSDKSFNVAINENENDQNDVISSNKEDSPGTSGTNSQEENSAHFRRSQRLANFADAAYAENDTSAYSGSAMDSNDEDVLNDNFLNVSNNSDPDYLNIER